MSLSLRKFAAAALAAAISFGAAAEQTLKVGTEPTFPPFEYIDDQDKSNVIGFDIDIINAIAKAEGFKVEIVKMPFDGLIPALLTSQLDAAIAGMTITEEREKKVDFTAPYYDSGLSAVILKENAEKFKKLADLKNSRICGQIGNTGIDFAKKLSGNVAAFNTNPEAFLELRAKGCDAVITDKPVNEFFLRLQKEGLYAEIPEFAEVAQFGIAVKKGNDEVLKALNEGFDKLRKSGEYDKIYSKWFHSGN